MERSFHFLEWEIQNYDGQFFGVVQSVHLQLYFIENVKEKNKIKIYQNRSRAQSKLHRQIYKGQDRQISGSMEQKIEWWKGLGEELQVDIETIVDEGS